MSGTSNKSGQKTSEASRNATSSPASESGAMPLERVDGQTILPFGQALVPAKVSVQAGNGAASQISVTYGPHGSGSLASARLTQSLASRLRAKTGLLGSTLFRLTWKERVTPSGRRIPALRASGRRTSGRDCTSWATPNTPSGGPNTKSTETHTGGMDLDGMAQLATWATPANRDYRSESATDEFNEKRWSHSRGKPLSAEATLAGWATPNTLDTVDRKGNRPSRAATGRKEGYLTEQILLTASGPPPNGSGAATKSSGQLNPAHSRWLMGLPTVWDDCAVTVTRSAVRKPKPSSKAILKVQTVK